MEGSGARTSTTEAPPTADPCWWGGVSLLLMALLFFVLIVLSTALTQSTDALSPLTPISGPGLQSLAEHADLARLAFAIGMVSDLVLMVGAIGLYVGPKRVNPFAMLLAAGFFGMYVLVDLLVSGMNVVARVSVAES